MILNSKLSWSSTNQVFHEGWSKHIDIILSQVESNMTIEHNSHWCNVVNNATEKAPIKFINKSQELTGAVATTHSSVLVSPLDFRCVLWQENFFYLRFIHTSIIDVWEFDHDNHSKVSLSGHENIWVKLRLFNLAQT